MSLKEYLKDNLRYFVLWLLMLGIIDFFLIMFKITSSLIWIITIVILSSMIIIYGYDYYRKSIFYQDFINKLNKLDKKCLITELIKKPNFLDGKILYDSLYEIDKSMYEEIEQYLQNINDFKEYIELWVHEVKLPIASSKLMIYNHETDKRKLQEQINRIENYVEQVLYYIRLENSEHDYLLKKCNLGKIIHKVIKRNQDSLLFHKISIEIKNINEIVISNSKWLEFIINQIISNSIKYRSKKDCKILFNVINDNNTIALEIIDNGIGIDKKEQKYVFNKSFTGQNGRLVSSSTGMGLYITKSLCDKLGHKIKLESTLHKYTKVSIYFNDDQYYNVVR